PLVLLPLTPWALLLLPSTPAPLSLRPRTPAPSCAEPLTPSPKPLLAAVRSAPTATEPVRLSGTATPRGEAVVPLPCRVALCATPNNAPAADVVCVVPSPNLTPPNVSITPW